MKNVQIHKYSDSDLIKWVISFHATTGGSYFYTLFFSPSSFGNTPCIIHYTANLEKMQIEDDLNAASMICNADKLQKVQKKQE